MTDSADSLAVQITPATVDRWEAFARDTEAKAQALMAQAREYKERAQQARALFAFADPMMTNVAEPVVSVTEVSLGAIAEPKKRSWREVIQKWVYDAPAGITSQEMREKINEDDDLSARFSASDKGFYNALTRLQSAKTVVKDYHRYFSPKAHSEYEPEPEVEGDQRFAALPAVRVHSPMGEAILDIVSANPGITSAEILRKLRTDAEFAATLTPHTTGAFNILARLVKRGQLLREDGVYQPGPRIGQRDPRSKWLTAKVSTLSLIEGVKMKD